ncbi:chaplin family protein [Nonomuraea sp. NPDC049480]|uniref:chaplin family protein n=1 Tax=Nonomuraea sp. NPDC049480 TaxID=3364353 RepID=UPI00378C1D1B
MRTWAKASTPAALLAVAVMSFAGSGTALADTSGNASSGGGNQVDLPISLPIDISGNSVATAGSAEASSQGGAEVVTNGRTGISDRTSGNASVGGGNQINAPISAPVNSCGSAVAVFGKSDAGCKGGATVRNQGKGGNRTSGDASVLGGNQHTAPISAPLNTCGNAVAIFGDATAGCKGGANVFNTGAGAGGNRTSGAGSVLGGNQSVRPVSAPVNICGNAVAVFGRAFSGCKGGSSVDNGRKRAYQSRHVHAGSTGNDTDGRFGAGSGNQVVAPVSLPVNVCGNATGNASAGCDGGATVRNSGAGGNRTSGQAGVGSGNQAVAPIAAPVNVCGNATASLGHAFAGCKGGASVKNGGSRGGGNHTSGQAGVGSGNQAVAPIAAPVNVCGNAAAALGDAAAGCLGGAHVGKPGYDRPHGYHRFAHAREKVAAAKGGLLPMLPAAPALAGLQGVPALGALQNAPAVGALQEAAGGRLESMSGVTKQVQDVSGVTKQVQDLTGVTQLEAVSGLTEKAQGAGATALPLVEDAAKTFGLPELPELPGLPTQAQAPAKPAKTAMSGRADRGGRTAGRPSSPLSPATDLIGSAPAGGAVTSVTRGLPVGGVGLMSAEQPAGVTGMNSSSLLALVLGAMFAASATLFASARRIRFGRK